MNFTRLGRTGLKVSRVCIGTNMFSDAYVPASRAASVIDAALEHGVNFIDTADMYLDGGAEAVLGEILQGRRDRFVLATKGFMPMGDGPNDRGLSRRHLIDAVDASLRRLRTDWIDLYQVHFWDPDTPLEETLRTLDDLVTQGKIRYIGCSNFAAWQLCKALWISDRNGWVRFETAQPEYNFARRGIEAELMPLCADQGIGILPFQVLMGGVLAGGYRLGEAPAQGSHMASRHAGSATTKYWNEENFARAERLRGIAEEAGCHPVQLVTAYMLTKPQIDSVIVGMSKPEQVASAAEAAVMPLRPGTIAELDKL